MHKFIRSRATLGLDKSNETYNCGCHPHKYEHPYHDDTLLNLLVAYRYIISTVPKPTLVTLHKLIQQIPKLPLNLNTLLTTI